MKKHEHSSSSSIDLVLWSAQSRSQVSRAVCNCEVAGRERGKEERLTRTIRITITGPVQRQLGVSETKRHNGPARRGALKQNSIIAAKTKLTSANEQESHTEQNPCADRTALCRSSGPLRPLSCCCARSEVCILSSDIRSGRLGLVAIWY